MSWRELNTLLVKEHVGIFKAANNYDIFDAGSGQKVLECREPNLGILSKFFRFTDYKTMTPFEIEIRDANGDLVLTVKRGISIFLSKVQVFDADNRYIGGFKQKLFSIGGKFDVLDAEERAVCSLNGNWTGWEFNFIDNSGHKLAEVTKKWSGLGKELFTSADNYVLAIKDRVEKESNIRKLILAAVMCIDMVLKER